MAERIRPLLHIVQMKYPEGLDRGVAACLQACKTDSERDQIYEIVSLSFQVRTRDNSFTTLCICFAVTRIFA